MSTLSSDNVMYVKLVLKECTHKIKIKYSMHQYSTLIHILGKDPPPWLLPAYCFASVIVWTENKNVTISDRFICFIFTVKQSAALAACVLRATSKKMVNFLRKNCTPEKILAMPLTLGDLAWGFSDLEMTWLFYCTGAATAIFRSTILGEAQPVNM